MLNKKLLNSFSIDINFCLFPFIYLQLQLNSPFLLLSSSLLPYNSHSANVQLTHIAIEIDLRLRCDDYRTQYDNFHTISALTGRILWLINARFSIMMDFFAICLAKC